ncbi:MAG: recombinase family protein [Carboxylicivirga sp.]|jgi:DNA invertase Pin-like site-specific DNA recombinase|nr:recombinase family protein [Carboxylicivirga sp.]
MEEVKYIRVSTVEQNTARQENSNFKLYIDRCSGTIPFEERKEGKKLLNDIGKGKVKAVRVHSIDRMGRNAMDIQKTIESITSKEINILVEDLGMNALSGDGTLNPMFKLITDLLANVAQMERDSIRKRQAEGIAIAKANGVYSKSRNRKKLSDDELLEKNKAIVHCLNVNMSLQKTAEVTGKSIPTICKVKKLMFKCF